MKKGLSTKSVLGGLIIMAVLISVVFYWQNDTFKRVISGANRIADKDIPGRIYDCAELGKRMNLEGENDRDWDGDGLPNSCDQCPELTSFTPQIKIVDARAGQYRTCEATDNDKDADCIPVGCCGNAFKEKDLRDGKLEPGWCDGKRTIKKETEENDKNFDVKPKYI